MSIFANSSATFQPIVSQAVNEADRQRFVGTRILPVVLSGSKKGKYAVIQASQFNNDLSKPRSPGSNFASASSEYTTGTFDCVEYGIENSLDDLDVQEASTDAMLDIATVAANQLADDLMIGHELRVASSLSGAGFTSTAATAAMSSASTAKPIQDINNAILRLNAAGIFSGINLIIEASLFQEMLQTDDLRALINGSGSLALSVDQVSRVVGVDSIVLCNTRYNAAKKGQSASSSKVWSDSTFYVAQLAQGPFANGGIGRTMGYSVRGGVFAAETYRTEQPPASVIRVRSCVDEIIINANAGQLITGA
jgi:hypothetical protein